MVGRLDPRDSLNMFCLRKRKVFSKRETLEVSLLWELVKGTGRVRLSGMSLGDGIRGEYLSHGDRKYKQRGLSYLVLNYTFSWFNLFLTNL